MTSESIESTTAATAGPDPRIGSRELVVMMSALMALMALGIDMMLPAFDDIRTAFDLGEGSNETGKIITVYFVGLALAQVGYGPLADRFGRKPVLLVGIAIYVAAALAAALAPTFSLLLVARFVWGIGAAGTRVVATAIIRDRFAGDEMARVMSHVMAVFMVVPIIAPVFGAGILAVSSWRVVFGFCVVAALAMAVWSTRLGETLHPDHVRPLSVGQSLGAYREVLRTPVTFGYSLATVFIQTVMTSYLAMSELIIGEIYDRQAQFPFIFGIVSIGFGISAITNGRMVERRGIDAMVNVGLSIAIITSAGLVAVSVAGAGRPSFWIFVPMLGLGLASFMLTMPNLTSASMTPVGHIAGSASALTSAMRLAGGAALAQILTAGITDSVTPFAVMMLAMCSLAAITVAVVRRRALSARRQMPASG